MLPDVGPQHRAVNRPISRGFDCQGQLGAARFGTLQNVVEGGVRAQVEQPLKAADREGEKGADIHGLNCMFKPNELESPHPYFLLEHTPYPVSMDIWPQRHAFAERVKAKRKRIGRHLPWRPRISG